VQTLAAYVIFLVIITGIGLAIILAAVVSLVAFAAVTWIKSRLGFLGFRIWQSSISGGLARAGARIENELQALKQAPLFDALGAAQRKVMPYATGQEPRVGDAVCDRGRRIGTVTHIMHRGVTPGELVIEWDDGTIGIRYSCHETLMLLERYPVAYQMPSLVLFADSFSRSPR